ncbi:cell surface A33 antigen-like isoform X2 [Channa argus]|uniref:cell surface A33 antigen-like isoform X2 n=1 Tax=Channa argus TaxID=215402 RepID=UPI003521E2A2
MTMNLRLQLLVPLLVSQHAFGVEVYEGDTSVLLPCQVNVYVSEKSTVVWSRDELRQEKVHVRQASGDDYGDQNKVYTNRTSMATDALQTGDLSLTLRKPTIGDSGSYNCTIRRRGKLLSTTEVELLVKDDQLKVVEVTEGTASVELPCTTKADLTGQIKVEWRRSVPHYMIIYIYGDDGNQTQDVSGRREMKKDPLRGSGEGVKDFSLTLKNPQLDDGGVYICTVYRNGDILRQKIVVLSVRETWIKTIRGLFPCCTNRSRAEQRPGKTEAGEKNEAPETQSLTATQSV